MLLCGVALDEKINGRTMLTMAFTKENHWKRIDGGKNQEFYGNRYVKIHSNDDGFSVFGVHIPAEKSDNDNQRELDILLSIVKGCNCDIIVEILMQVQIIQNHLIGKC